MTSWGGSVPCPIRNQPEMGILKTEPIDSTWVSSLASVYRNHVIIKGLLAFLMEMSAEGGGVIFFFQNYPFNAYPIFKIYIFIHVYRKTLYKVAGLSGRVR